MELGVLCDCEVAVIVMTRDGHLASFSSQGMENILRRYALAAQSPHEVHTEEELYNRYVREPRQRMVSKETAKRKREGGDEEFKEASIQNPQPQQQQKDQTNDDTFDPAITASAAVVTSPLRKRAKPTMNLAREIEQQPKEMTADPKSEKVNPSAPVSTPSKRRAKHVVNAPPITNNNSRKEATVKAEDGEEEEEEEEAAEDAPPVHALAIPTAAGTTKDDTDKQDANLKDTVTTTTTTVSAQTQQIEIPAPMETAFNRLGREFDKLTNQVQTNGALSEAMGIRKANHIATASLEEEEEEEENGDDGGDHTAVVEADVSTDDDGGNEKKKKKKKMGGGKTDRSSTPPGKGAIAIDKSSAAVPSAMNGGLGAVAK